ncbi:hypothetical protein K1719_002625 [Acacia pycnantha]|nr:hypothetical protein K1719_002625 [Acacia pycnantha]
MPEEQLKLLTAITPTTIQRMTNPPSSANKPQRGSFNPPWALIRFLIVPPLESLSQQVTELRLQFATLLLQQHLI